MSIGNVLEKGNSFYVHDEDGKLLCVKTAIKDDELIGYTSTTFSIKQGNTIHTYDEKGRRKSIKTI
ncbi:MAG: hypothetical protein H7Z73_02110 [Candidatus Saccharibacteria bacterium]|nr:hypothetical protein [Moraxellaceae bacterium]